MDSLKSVVLRLFSGNSEPRFEISAYRAAWRQYQDLLESIDGIVWQAEADTFCFNFVSRQAERLLGYPVEEWYQPGFWREHIHPDDRERAIRYCVDSTRAQRSHEIEYRMIAADGSTVWLRDLVSVLVERGQPKTLRGVMVDITRQKAAERASAEADRRSAFLAEFSGILSQSLRSKEIFQMVSDLLVANFCEWCLICLTGQEGDRIECGSHREPQQRSSLRRLSSCRIDSSNPEGIPKVLRTGQGYLVSQPDLGRGFAALFGLDCEAWNTEFTSLGCSSYLIVPLVARGKVIGAILMVSVRGEGLELSFGEELARRVALAVDNCLLYETANEAIRLREEFISIASHELRTPLTPLRLHLQLLKQLASEGQLSTASAKRILEMADQQLGRLLEMVTDLLDVSGIQAGQLRLFPKETDLAELASQVIERYQIAIETSGCIVSFRGESPVVGVWDTTRIVQVIENLLSNAIKYGRGRPIEIEVENVRGFAVLRVRDHGIGIAKENLERIFSRFERAVSAGVFRGLGLGLYIVRQIVESHGGKIRVESKPGEGSTFTVELPLRQTSVRRSAA